MTWTQGTTSLFNGGIIIGGGWLGIILTIILFVYIVLMLVCWGKILFSLLNEMEDLSKKIKGDNEK
jgi:hypothetical protein